MNHAVINWLNRPKVVVAKNNGNKDYSSTRNKDKIFCTFRTNDVTRTAFLLANNFKLVIKIGKSYGYPDLAALAMHKLRHLTEIMYMA